MHLHTKFVLFRLRSRSLQQNVINHIYFNQFQSGGDTINRIVFTLRDLSINSNLYSLHSTMTRMVPFSLFIFIQCKWDPFEAFAVCWGRWEEVRQRKGKQELKEK